MELYGSGGKSSKAIVDTYDTAVKKLETKVSEMTPKLPDPTEWQTIKDDIKKKEDFILAFKDAAEQLNLVEQYYEFKWDDTAFGIDEHTWLQYVGAYKNLTWKPGTPPPPTSAKPLVGKTRLAGTQVVDAAHILKLIGSKVSSTDGVQTVDVETLRIIHEQIQELSNMGEFEQAQLLKEFVDNELVPGKLSSTVNFDSAFEVWRAEKLKSAVDEFAIEWGVDAEILVKAVNSYSAIQPDVIPYINDLISTVDFNKASNQTAGNILRHNMRLTSILPQWMAGIKQKYN